MSRLFIVGIGGTGSRVIKAFTMLLAAGVKANSPYEVVPLIIDPHSENKDLQRTERLLEKYEKVRNTLGDNEGFFSTKILRLSTIAESVQTQAGTTYRFELTDMERPFKNYIGYSSLEYPDKLMADFLFSGKSIESIPAGANRVLGEVMPMTLFSNLIKSNSCMRLPLVLNCLS